MNEFVVKKGLIVDSGGIQITGSSFSSGHISAVAFSGSFSGSINVSQLAYTASYVSASGISGTIISCSYSSTASFSIRADTLDGIDSTGFSKPLASGSTYPFTSSWSSNSLTASFVSGYQLSLGTSSTYPITSSWSIRALTSSLSPGYQLSLGTGSVYPITASWSERSLTSSLAPGYQLSLGTSSTYPITASWSLNTISASYAPGTSGASLGTGSSYPFTASWAIRSLTSSFVSGYQLSLGTGSTYPITASWAANATPSFAGKTDRYVPVWDSDQLTNTSSIYDTGRFTGIGVNTPAARLDVSSGSSPTVVRQLVLRNLSTTGSGAGAGAGIQFVTHTAITDAGGIDVVNDVSGETSMRFRTYTGEKMVIHGSGSGNVGIGTTEPSNFKLEVAGDIGPSVDSSYDLGSNTIRWRRIYADEITGSKITGSMDISFLGKTNNYIPKWSSNTLTGTSLIYDNGSSVGIGTSTISSMLQIVSSNSSEFSIYDSPPGIPIFEIKNTAGLPNLILSDPTAGLTAEFNISSTSPQMRLRNNSGISRLTTVYFETNNNSYIDTDYNVGIGTPTPSYFKLQVSGSVGPDSSDTWKLGDESNIWRSVHANRISGSRLYLLGSTSPSSWSLQQLTSGQINYFAGRIGGGYAGNTKWPDDQNVWVFHTGSKDTNGLTSMVVRSEVNQSSLTSTNIARSLLVQTVCTSSNVNYTAGQSSPWQPGINGLTVESYIDTGSVTSSFFNSLWIKGGFSTSSRNSRFLEFVGSRVDCLNSGGSTNSGSGTVYSQWLYNEIAANNSYGLYINNNGGINSRYGVYVASMTTVPLPSNRWAFYNAGANDNSYFAGKIGIGTSTLTGQLSVYELNNISSGNGYSGFFQSEINAAGSANLYSVYGSSTGIGTSNLFTGEIVGVLGSGSLSFDSNITASSIFGGKFGASIDTTSGRSTSLTALHAYISNRGSQSDSVSQATLLFLAPIAGTNILSKYGIYQSGSSDLNYFAGNVGVGVISPSLFKLQVSGSIGPDTNNAYNLGSGSLQFSTVYSNKFAAGGVLSASMGDIQHSNSQGEKVVFYSSSINNYSSLGYYTSSITYKSLNGHVFYSNMTSPRMVISSSGVQITGSGGSSTDLRVLGRISSGVSGSPGQGGLWVDGGNNQLFGSITTQSMGIWNGSWILAVSQSGAVGIGQTSELSKDFQLTVSSSMGPTYSGSLRIIGEWRVDAKTELTSAFSYTLDHYLRVITSGSLGTQFYYIPVYRNSP